jgi:hypothetical protein
MREDHPLKRAPRPGPIIHCLQYAYRAYGAYHAYRAWLTHRDAIADRSGEASPFAVGAKKRSWS